MAATRFKFVSPRVYVNEIDQSQLPATPTTSTGFTLITFVKPPNELDVSTWCSAS